MKTNICITSDHVQQAVLDYVKKKFPNIKDVVVTSAAGVVLVEGTFTFEAPRPKRAKVAHPIRSASDIVND